MACLVDCSSASFSRLRDRRPVLARYLTGTKMKLLPSRCQHPETNAGLVLDERPQSFILDNTVARNAAPAIRDLSYGLSEVQRKEKNATGGLVTHYGRPPRNRRPHVPRESSIQRMVPRDPQSPAVKGRANPGSGLARDVPTYGTLRAALLSVLWQSDTCHPLRENLTFVLQTRSLVIFIISDRTRRYVSTERLSLSSGWWHDGVGPSPRGKKRPIDD